MISKPLIEVADEDIQSLIADAVSESRTLDYKETLPGGTDDDRKEFLADVSSFANAMGGDLIYGIAEQRDQSGKTTGVPRDIAPLSANLEPEIRRLESIIRDGIEPRVAGIGFRSIDTLNGTVLVLRVPRSWSSPHMVVFKNHSRFFSRASTGKYQLDVTELRAAFVAADARASRVAGFRDERIGRMVAGDTPVPLVGVECGRAILHVVPAAALDSTFTIAFPEISSLASDLRPLGGGGWNYRHNFDGILTYAGQSTNTPSRAYSQLFRSGSLEYVGADLLVGNSNGFISYEFERDFVEALRGAVKLYERLGIEPPLFIMASMVGVRGRQMWVPSGYRSPHGGATVDRDVLTLPDVLLRDFVEDIPSALRPVHDAVWQAAGWPRSINYDERGAWSFKG